MKVIIIGNSGSGKTWLARRLALHFSAELIHFDKILWEPGGFNVKRKPDEITSLIQQSKLASAWIAEGVFGDIAEQYLDDAHALIWLDFSWDICLERLKNRGSESKTHMNREQSERGLEELITWASQYTERESKSSFSGHHRIFNSFPRKKLRLCSENEVHQFIENPTIV